VLYNYGGVSVDCDAECIRPLDKIPHIDMFDMFVSKNSLNRIENKVASFGLSKDLTMLNNATIGCAKNHPVMKQFIEFLIENESWNEDEAIDTQLRTGPLIMSVFFNKFIDDGGIFVMDAEIFEPWDISQNAPYSITSVHSHGSIQICPTWSFEGTNTSVITWFSSPFFCYASFYSCLYEKFSE
jgi:mannosyltransferase OCH1-like enzyme